ncbi:hypothetical protein GCM10023172_11190 [Hymenobacter ginsengisoli]|uniref:DUF4270 domain-containing protein n=1 Tax=Hymenobacter ginsengisoli TaxID=1051626 RepID=A0ABP8Q3C7_9BACT|nr:MULTISPECIES: DUF4270 family protein [unclassified Hymenobacter]MBO2031705.1 DUF4270 family protein [Hymenobacter sp. BT559]
MSRSNKPHLALAVWGRLLAMLGLVALAASCTNTASDIGVGLPDANVDTGAFLVDTLTVRSSTVLRDSVPSSNSNYLFVGQYTDPLLGKLTARSAFRLGLTELFTPDPTAVFDSITLVLKPDNYRYGDTTKTQALVEVHRLNTGISFTKYSYTSPKLTTMDYDSVNLLNYSPVLKINTAPRGRARPNITTLRLPLDPAFGQALLAKGKAGQLSTQDDLDAYLPGLVITPAANDEGALIRLSATSADAVMHLYSHVPTDPTTVITTNFSLATGSRHFFQFRVNRNLAGVPNLPRKSLESVPSALTGERTIIEGALGLQTRLEFPYLKDLRQFGNNLTITNAQITASVPTSTLTPFVPAPPALSIYYTDANNHPLALYQPNITYNTSISTLTSIEQGTYNWSMTSYIRAVLANTIPNNGLLLASATPDVPSRVFIGSTRNTQNKLSFRVYLIRVQ